MDKLNIMVVSERTVTREMGGCGKYYEEFCGTRSCSASENGKN